MTLDGGVGVILAGVAVVDEVATVLALVVSADDLHLVYTARGAEASPVLCNVIL